MCARSGGTVPPEDPAPDSTGSRPDGPPRRRLDESMTLLTSMMERPLDPGYAAAAERRRQQGLPAATGSRRPLLIVSVLVIGLIIGMSTASLRSRDPARSSVRTDIIRQIEDRQKGVDEDSRTARRLQVEIDAATTRLGPTVGGTPKRELEAMRISSGLVPVRGPGMRLVIDDAPDTSSSADGDPRTGTDDKGRVRSSDLQIVTNGLWSSGAEAIAINGQRLTSRSAIRFAGEAILVNFRPLTRPYTIDAIGEPGELRDTFASSSGGTYLEDLEGRYGIEATESSQDALRLPGATNVSNQHAKVVPQGSSVPAVTPRTKETS